MPDPMDPRTADAWQPPDPALAEALRAYGFEASPPALDDDPDPDREPCGGRPLRGCRRSAGARPGR